MRYGYTMYEIWKYGVKEGETYIIGYKYGS